MTNRDVVTLKQASFEERQSLALHGRIVEFTPGELDMLGAVTDDIPVSEDDFLTGDLDE
ncbi:hypothetical protein WH357_21315 [Enterobacter ludwigii]